ncbi:MAG: hypothetical protein V3V41_08010 [Candidatus Heimdallarchaeota archaeon]
MTFKTKFHFFKKFGPNDEGSIDLHNGSKHTMMFQIEDSSGTDHIILSYEEVKFLYESFKKMLGDDA